MKKSITNVAAMVAKKAVKTTLTKSWTQSMQDLYNCLCSSESIEHTDASDCVQVACESLVSSYNKSQTALTLNSYLELELFYSVVEGVIQAPYLEACKAVQRFIYSLKHCKGAKKVQVIKKLVQEPCKCIKGGGTTYIDGGEYVERSTSFPISFLSLDSIKNEREVTSCYSDSDFAAVSSDMLSLLTEVEKLVFKAMWKGFKQTEIARALKMSTSNTSKLVQRIRCKIANAGYGTNVSAVQKYRTN